MRSLLLVPALALVLAGCGSSDDGGAVAEPTTGTTTGTTAAAGGTALRISGFAYEPTPLTVAPGATITVTNFDSATHDVKADAFKSGDADKGKPVTFTAPTKPGTYDFICSYHPSMKGSLVVK